MGTPVNDYEVMFGKEIFKTVTMLQIGAPGADSLREVAAIMKVRPIGLKVAPRRITVEAHTCMLYSGSYVTAI